jgi:hypothetical protein
VQKFKHGIKEGIFRRIAVTSSLNEISPNQLENRMGGFGGGFILLALIHFCKQSWNF